MMTMTGPDTYEYEAKEDFKPPPCVHCGAPVEDYYMVWDRLWYLAVTNTQESEGQMHWDCLKARLASHGHDLQVGDLTIAPVNKWFLEGQNFFPESSRDMTVKNIIQVERVGYYDDPKSNQTLRYAEVAPPKEHEHEGAVCGCTTSVLEKPEGIPSHLVQGFHFLSEGFDFPLTSGQITFGELGSPKGHAYFWYRLPKETSIQVEITLPGYGLSDCFFATVMKGNAIDGSRLFNGHSPSRIFDPAKVDPNAIYVYNCGYGGKEAVHFFETPGEISLWNETFRLVSIVQGRVAQYEKDYTSPVEVLRVLLEADPVLREAVIATRELLAPVAAQLTETELFRLGDDAYQATHPNRNRT